MNDDLRLKAFLQEVASRLIGSPEGIEVSVHDGRRATRFEIHAPAESRGQLIGKEGMTIRSIRTLASISGHKNRRRFEIEIPG
ncbi:MAG: KH domain-containing protein [Acidobacteriota bacterium]|nr:KH domain-containing protein [Acidobacteriota bacterium]MDQ7086815.1 KH domain-containing protein [Acidobacteriota bacterium]